MAATRRIGFITDIEGNWDYWQSYIKLSSIIEYDSKNNLIFKDDTSLFVFGGDVCDKGTGSIRITKQLVAFKKKYPDRVVLILGNRDINKMRWTSELAQSELDNWENVPGPYWVKKEAQVTPKQFLQKMVDQAKQQNVTIQSLNTVANRIKWMLEATMGSAGDFDRRRTELSLISKRNVKTIPDVEVATSYVDSVKPTGEMFEFLQLGQLAFIHEGTLFVHGGVHESSLGYVPFSDIRYNNVKEWVDKLNEWYKLEFIDWTLRPKWDYRKDTKLVLFRWGEKFDALIQGVPKEEAEIEDKSKWSARGGHRLMDYALPTSKGSVVYSHMFNKLFNCHPLEEHVKKDLVDHGIYRVVTGHQPHGNAPAVNKFYPDFEVIAADSSYSDMTAPDNRGRAVSEVVIVGRRVFVQGFLQDGAKIKYNISLDGTEGDRFIGKMVPLPDDKEGNSFWVKAKLEVPKDGKEYLLCKVTGFVVAYDYMSEAKLDELIYNRMMKIDDNDIIEIKSNNKEVSISKLDSVDGNLSDITMVPFFREWFDKIQKNPDLTLKKVLVQSVDHSGFTIRFIKLRATIVDKNGENVSGVVLLRGSSIAVLCVLLVDDGRKLVVAIKHPRSPLGRSDHVEIPVGMQEHKSPIGVIRNLLQTECGIELETDTAVNLSQYLFNNPEKEIYVCPGSCDQGIRFYLFEKHISAEQLTGIQNTVKTNQVDEVAPYETVLIPLDELEQRCDDANAFLAVHLYNMYLRKTQDNPPPSPRTPSVSPNITPSNSRSNLLSSGSNVVPSSLAPPSRPALTNSGTPIPQISISGTNAPAISPSPSTSQSSLTTSAPLPDISSPPSSSGRKQI